ncbi:putative ubiquitin-specific protease UBP12 [Sporobolomyces koalae]|uniref:putative ubiquitin-specific protease UBP12 n=1 Tax=Sporobolomyces koalae TaxID=500713 RepID=UPI0031802C73
MVPERPYSPHRLASASPSRLKRPLSSPSSSASKRANSEDLMDQGQVSDTEGSLGASRLNISSTPASPQSVTGAESTEDSPPAYDDVSRPFAGPPGDTQLDIIKELKAGLLEAGDPWNLVSRIWYRRWITACSGTAETKDDDALLAVEEVGPMDNSNLVLEGGQLRKPLVEGVDLELLPSAAYALLRQWYGSLGPDIERVVVSSGTFGSERVEFYPPSFQFFLLCPTDGGSSSPVSIPNLETAPTVSLASSTPFSALQRAAAEAFSLGRPVRLWRLPEAGDPVSASEGPAFVLSDKLNETDVELLEIDPDMTLDDALLSDSDCRIAVEQQKPNGSWLVDSEAVLLRSRASTRGATPSTDPVQATTSPEKKSRNLFSNGWSSTLHKPKSNGNLSGAATQSQSGTTVNAKASGSGTSGLISTLTGALTRSKTGPAKAGQRGLVGLSNLGNTCFMNSAIQCMSNTKELKDYFLSGAYKNELNPDNPLGMRGQVAEAFGQLIERMWHGSGSSVAPREFKQAVARFAPQFSGYGQQDSQELLAFLLDGTHEDLNRILKKPGTSAPDWEGGGDKELVEMAKTCWDQYRSRNDSVVVDLFQGQYRSTVVCPDCDKVSITFDPFMYVTTNLPVTKKWSGTVYVVPLDPSKKVISLEIEVPKNGTVKTLKSCVGKVLDMEPKSLVVAEEWHSKFFKEWPDDDMITEINTKNDKIIIYETTGTLAQPRFRKNKTPAAPADPNAPIILVVLHRKIAPKTSRLTFGVSGGSEYLASPFVLSLTPDEASTVEGIQRALLRQYSRVTSQGDELLEAFDKGLAASAGAGADAPTTELADDATAGSTPADSAMDVDELPPALDSVSSSSSITLAASTSSQVPEPAPAPAASTASRPLFTIKVSKNRRDPTGLPLNQSAFQADEETLEERLETVRAATRLVSEDYDDMFTESTESSPKEPRVETASESAAEPAKSAPPAASIRPILRTGDYVVAEWDPSAYDYFFSEQASRWEEVEEVVDPALAVRKSLGKQKQTITLDQCLTEFTKEERLGEEDMWYCSACKDFKQATKKVEIWKAPDVLVFALKRFSSGRYTRDKIDDFVDFPLEGFDMEPFVEGDKVERRLAEEMGEGNAPAISEPDSLLYDLYAVSNHFGGLGGGHYTAFAKNPDNNKWYDFDDSRVSPLSDPTRAVSSSAYLLFYRRRTARPIGGAKSISAVESAIQSRQASAAPSQVPSLMPSPFGSTDNLALPDPNSSVMPGTFDSTAHSHRFAGMFTPAQRGDDEDDDEGSVKSNEPASPRSSTHGDAFDRWNPTPPDSPQPGSFQLETEPQPQPDTVQMEQVRNDKLNLNPGTGPLSDIE